MNYRQTIAYLYQQLPMFSHVGERALNKSLDKTYALCKILGNPEQQFKSIHVAGTNGKGSTCHLLSSILQKAGYKTGLFTSPHILDFRERIKVNGNMISEQEVVDFTENYKTVFEDIKPSFFEMTVALAFKHFAEQEVEVAVIEVGLGGRLDATNILHPLVSIITNISYDHTGILGDSISLIAQEKAGIIKPNTPTIIGAFDTESYSVFESIAHKYNSPLYPAFEIWRTTKMEDRGSHLWIDINNGKKKLELSLDLTGGYQSKNICTVACAIDVLRNLGFKIDDLHFVEGVSIARQLTGLQGRWQTLNNQPKVICDIGHNEAGILEVVSHLQRSSYQELHIVLGIVMDKDVSSILQLLPKDAKYYYCQANIERALDKDTLAKIGCEMGLNGKSYPDTNTAYNAALANADTKDLIFVGGSTFVVAEIIEFLSQ